MKRKVKIKELKHLPWDVLVELPPGCFSGGFVDERLIWDIKERMQAENLRILFYYPAPKYRDNYFGYREKDRYIEWTENKGREYTKVLDVSQMEQIKNSSL